MVPLTSDEELLLKLNAENHDLRGRLPIAEVRVAGLTQALEKVASLTGGGCYDCMISEGEVCGRCREIRSTVAAALSSASPRREDRMGTPSALDSPELLEILAAIEHERWSGWETYRATKNGAVHPSGESFYERWFRQRETAYADLSEAEKESDRVEARKGLAAIREFLARSAAGLDVELRKAATEASQFIDDWTYEPCECQDCPGCRKAAPDCTCLNCSRCVLCRICEARRVLALLNSALASPTPAITAVLAEIGTYKPDWDDERDSFAVQIDRVTWRGWQRQIAEHLGTIAPAYDEPLHPRAP